MSEFDGDSLNMFMANFIELSGSEPSYEDVARWQHSRDKATIEKLLGVIEKADAIFCMTGFKPFEGVEEKHEEWYRAKKDAGL